VATPLAATPWTRGPAPAPTATRRSHPPAAEPGGSTAERSGIFDFADPRNPFVNHSVVYVPYCTGDVHLGNNDGTYAPDLTVHHKGYVNGSAALDHLTATLGDATEVVVIGESAGSIAAPLYAGLIADRLPAATVTVLADGSGSYADAPEINEIIAGCGAGHRSFPGLFIRSGRHDPDIVFARHDYAYDETQQSYLELVGPSRPAAGRRPSHGCTSSSTGNPSTTCTARIAGPLRSDGAVYASVGGVVQGHEEAAVRCARRGDVGVVPRPRLGPRAPRCSAELAR
jgi:Pectinacetylesterase